MTLVDTSLPIYDFSTVDLSSAYSTAHPSICIIALEIDVGDTSYVTLDTSSNILTLGSNDPFDHGVHPIEVRAYYSAW